MKIAVMIPFYKIMDTPAVESLIAMLADIHSRGDSYQAVFTHSMYIEKARTYLFKTALQHCGDCDYFLMIDTDHVYKASTLYKLIGDIERHNLPFVSALYIARGDPKRLAHCRIKESDGYPHKILVDDVGPGLNEADVVGMGFCVFKKSFVKEFVDKHVRPFETGIEGSGEDEGFCRQAREDGHKIYFDSDAKVGHITLAIL